MRPAALGPDKEEPRLVGAGVQGSRDGCGGRIRTDDLRVMSPTSCRCSTPRCQYTRGSGMRRGRGRRAWRRARRRHQVQLLVRLRVAVEPRLLLVRGPRLQRLHVLAIAGVLGGDGGVLPPQVGDLLAELVADVRLLREGDPTPRQPDADGAENDQLPHAERVRAHAARDGESSGVSHAVTFVVNVGGGGDYIKWVSSSPTDRASRR